MTRPVYENAQTLQAEARFAARLAASWGCQVKKNPARYKLDFSMMRGSSVAGFLEVKCRDCTRGQYLDYMLAADKFMAARHLTTTLGLRAVLAVEWRDSAGWADLSSPDLGYRIGHGGRFDRGDPDDLEPVVYIPISKFKILRPHDD